MDNLITVTHLTAQILIGFYFVFFGFWNINHWKPMMEVLLKKKVPSPWLFLSFAIGWQVVLGFFVMMGFLVKLSALLLIPLVVFFMFVLHPFWGFTGELRKQHLALFITNLTMNLGALLMIATH